ncbi:MAG TPA: hypothetical protein V6D20_05055, partial [Candidatus Obscuribacterales bacterium]
MSDSNSVHSNDSSGAGAPNPNDLDSLPAADGPPADPIEHLLSVLGGAAADSPYREALNELGPSTLIDFLELSDDDFTRSRFLTVSQARTLIAVRGWAYNRASWDADDFVARFSAESFLRYRTHCFSIGRPPAGDVPVLPAAAAAPATAATTAPAAAPSDVPPTTTAPAPAAVPVTTTAPSPSAIPVATSAPVTSTVPAAPGTSSAPVVSPTPSLAAFQRGIRRDMSVFTKFQDKAHFNTWNRHFRSTAVSQGLEDALDPDYIPATPDAIAVFAQIKKFVHAVLVHCIKEPTAVSIVRRYTIQNTPEEGDGQQLYAELCRKFGSGVIAQNTRTTLEQQLMSMRLSKDWSKPICTFLAG